MLLDYIFSFHRESRDKYSLARFERQVVPLELSIIKKMLEGLLRGFVVGLGIELGTRALVMLELLSGIVPGFLFVVFWCGYSNYFYYNIAGDTFTHNLVAAIFLSLFFGVVAALVLFLQGYGLNGFPLYASGFSLLLSWATRVGVRRARIAHH